MRAIGYTLLLAGCASTPGNMSGQSSYDHGERAIIDAHFHDFPPATGRPPLAEQMVALDAAGIDRVAVHYISKAAYDRATELAPERILRGVSFPCWKDQRGAFFMCEWGDTGFPDIAWLRSEIDAGRLTHLGEMSFIYAGIEPADPRMDPYWSLAAEKRIPVMVHINRGPPPGNPMRARMGCCPNFDAELGNPERYRPILQRYPDLKLVLQHYGFPPLPMFDNIGYVEESIALMKDYPSVHADMSTFHSVPFISAEQHADAVRRLQSEGLLDRLLFATDTWPAEPVIARYDAMDFLSAEEKRAIFHDNAARLFGID